MTRPTVASLAADPRAQRALHWAARAVLVAGLVSCVARGADGPADPALGEPATTTTTTAPAAAVTPPPSAPAPGG